MLTQLSMIVLDEDEDDRNDENLHEYTMLRG